MSNATATTAVDQKVLIGLAHGIDEPENVLIAYLVGVEAIRAGKEAVMWLTKDGISIAIDGFSESVEVLGAPSIKDLHHEYINSGGRFLACPVCVKLRGEVGATWTKNAEVAGAAAVYEYTAAGALVFNY